MRQTTEISTVCPRARLSLKIPGTVNQYRSDSVIFIALPPGGGTVQAQIGGHGFHRLKGGVDVILKGDPQKKETIEVESVAIRFAGDSGDGMQLTGDRFTSASAIAGNDLRTFPDFPAEIRAPIGTLAGVSAFQINFSSDDIHTPGDALDVLVVMNPAAMKANIDDLKRGGILIANTDNFNEKNFKKADLDSNPLEDEDTKSRYQVIEVPITEMTRHALDELDLASNLADRCKNFFALGMMFWMYSRPMEPTKNWIEEKFGNRSEIVRANTRALEAGYYYGENSELMVNQYQVHEATYPEGKYRTISGNVAAAYGFIAAAKKLGLKLFWGAYPITPASDVLHELSKYKNFGVYTFQAEDEIAAASAVIGASYAGALGVTCSSGPGIVLKGEAIGLAVMTELPLVILNVQRAGPSTGLPTKTEQADLLLAMYGRNSESPLPIIAASTPSDCYAVAIEASRIAVKYMTPVMLLTDGYLANGSEPWLIPSTPATLRRAPPRRCSRAAPVSRRIAPPARHPRPQSRGACLLREQAPRCGTQATPAADSS